MRETAINILPSYQSQQMLTILYHIREFLLSVLKRYSPVRLLQYLLALCRAVFSRCQSKCRGQNSSHEFLLPKILSTLADGKESLSEEDIVTPIGHVISASRTLAQVEPGPAPIADIPTLCVCATISRYSLCARLTDIAC